MRQPNAPSQEADRTSTATPDTSLPVQAAPPSPISDRRLLVYVFLVAILVLFIAILCSVYADQFATWFGFGADPLPSSSIATPVVIYQQSKTLWDWLQLLLVPLVLVLGGFWLTRMENRTALAMQQQREQAARAAEQRQAEQHAATEEARRKETERIEEERRKETERIEEERRKESVRLEEERAQDATLQAYLDKMTELLLDYKLRTSKEGDEVRSVARARTVPVLRVLDAQRTATVAQFLIEADLVQGRTDADGTMVRPMISLQGAQLQGANLQGANLQGANLQGADLHGAILIGANLTGTNLQGAILIGANLQGVILIGAYLRGAILIRANLQRAILTGADLRGAILTGADLRGANLTGADLRGAILIRANLQRAILTGAILTRADLERAILDEANLELATLGEANLELATLGGAKIEGADFINAKNLNRAILDDDQRILLGLAPNPQPLGSKNEEATG